MKSNKVMTFLSFFIIFLINSSQSKSRTNTKKRKQKECERNGKVLEIIEIVEKLRHENITRDKIITE